MLASTYWHNPKGFAQYIGAYFFDGFHSDVFLRIGALLPRLLPRIFGGHEVLMNMWGYRYVPDDDGDESESSAGILTHADEAAVNVNIWLTPDAANLGRAEDGEGGGLVIYRRPAPLDWDFVKCANFCYHVWRLVLFRLCLFPLVRER